MKQMLKLALLAGLFTTGIVAAQADSKQDGSEAMARFEGVKKVFDEKGLEAISFLNGLDASGNKGRDTSDGLQVGADNFNDPDAPLICIGADDTYIVHTGNPSLVGQSAVSGEHIWRDGTGIALVAKARQALSRGATDGKTAIDFVNNSRMKNPREGQAMADNDMLAIADGRYFGKNFPEGSFCATNAELFEARDNSDANRKGGKDAGEGKIGHDVDSKKHHAKKHHKHKAKAAEHKADAAHTADAHKDAAKKDEHKADAAEAHKDAPKAEKK